MYFLNHRLRSAYGRLLAEKRDLERAYVQLEEDFRKLQRRVPRRDERGRFTAH
ncbi:hypothetical protein ABZ714_12955 [Streptomyces sp. NPDC006798]|uniref:hypothetical protein n=1 Tax=Streptomyces sp. NPDC006798 TaxID=3155462 RepID=UPI0033FB7723